MWQVIVSIFLFSVKLYQLVSFRSTCWLFQIVYEGEILYLFTVTFWEKYDFLIIPLINTRNFTLNQLVHVDREFCITLVFMEILHQIAGQKSTFEICRSLENERFLTFGICMYNRLTKLGIPYKIALVFKVILYITSKLKTIHVIIN